LYYYTAYSYSFFSDIPLPEFVEIAPCRSAIQISKFFEEYGYEHNHEIVCARKIPNGVSFDWEAIGRYEICDGRTIRVFPRNNTIQETTRVPMFGMALAAVLQQNDLLVLHGSAVEINGRALIILGKKGYGKSTLTAALINRSHRLISDDVTAISVNSLKSTTLPGVPILKLWPDSLRELGLDIETGRLFFPGISKRLYSFKSKFCTNSLPIGAICVLGYGDHLKLSHINSVQKLLHLSSFQYFSNFRQAFSSARHKTVFDQCSTLAKNVKMHELTRSWDLNVLDCTCELIEEMFV
jgi:hypothetical protein